VRTHVDVVAARAGLAQARATGDRASWADWRDRLECWAERLLNLRLQAHGRGDWAAGAELEAEYGQVCGLLGWSA
jgi:hypothetical protein